MGLAPDGAQAVPGMTGAAIGGECASWSPLSAAMAPVPALIDGSHGRVAAESETKAFDN